LSGNFAAAFPCWNGGCVLPVFVVGGWMARRHPPEAHMADGQCALAVIGRRSMLAQVFCRPRRYVARYLPLQRRLAVKWLHFFGFRK
jgi:hypothetical protein